MILFVAAAGNSGQNTEFNHFALRIDLPNMLIVGAVAKMLAVQPTLTTAAIVAILRRTADTRGTNNLRLLNPAKAVAEARARSSSPDL